MLRQKLKNTISETIGKKFKIPPQSLKFEVFYPTHSDFGDYSSNIVFSLAKYLNEDREKIASQIIEALKRKLGKEFEKIEYTDNGFLNFYFSKNYLIEKTSQILWAKEKFGQSNLGRGMKINLEFVSANPTGPLTLGNARSAASGNALANIMKAAGYKITKEYYINDTGNQVEILGESIARRFLQLKGQNTDFSENLYQGEYITDLAKEMDKELKEMPLDDFERLVFISKNFGIEKLIKRIKTSLAEFGIKFDVWFSEKYLYDSGEIKKVFDFLKFGDLVYEKEGAWWLKAKDFGLSEDPVLIKSDGQPNTSSLRGRPTYLMGDIAYTKNKFQRGFTKIINIWGADHHGDVARLKAGAQALNFNKEKVIILLHQLVSIKKEGKLQKMSKRAGQFVLLEDLLKEVKTDVIKYFFISKSLDTHIEFDLDLAKEESEKNPVFYIQYALARISSIFEKANLTIKKSPAPYQFAAGQVKKMILKFFRKKLELKYDYNLEEISLMRQLIIFPEIIEEISENYQVHLIANYAYELAGIFHNFYESSKILSEDEKIKNNRLALATATWQVLRNCLALMGLSQPRYL